jgi:uncharacterized protein DUF6983
MIQIPITNIPNQSLSISLDGNVYDISIHACRDNGVPGTGIVAFDVTINNTVIITGIRALPDFPIIPARYLENGNFLVTTMNNEYPDWRQFGITQSLVYVSQSELTSIRAGV